MTTQNLWDAAKSILKGKSRVKQAYLKKWEKYQINNLTLYLNKLEKIITKNLPKLVEWKKL